MDPPLLPLTLTLVVAVVVNLVVLVNLVVVAAAAAVVVEVVVVVAISVVALVVLVVKAVVGTDLCGLLMTLWTTSIEVVLIWTQGTNRSPISQPKVSVLAQY